MEDRASKHYKYFVETVHYYQELNEGFDGINSILQTPYPLFYSLIMERVKMKKKQQEKQKQQKHQIEMQQRSTAKSTPLRPI